MNKMYYENYIIKNSLQLSRTSAVSKPIRIDTSKKASN